jgi:predicted dehydrogenase
VSIEKKDSLKFKVNFSVNRRSFLKRAVLAAGGVAAFQSFPGPKLFAAPEPSDRLRCVQIGCGARSMAHLDWLVNQSKDHIVAIVDPDEKCQAKVLRWLKKQNQNPEKVQVFTDYRVMFDKIGNQIDAVFIATPNHHHAPAAMLAMEAGKGVYCEKPLCHDIAEARKLREMAARTKTPTQMGNQGHCEEGYHRLCEFIRAGVIGKVTETHSWTDRANGGIGPRPPSLPVPKGLHWDFWIGPAPYRDYHAELHPHAWHGWYDFGNGSIGNMGCHVLDGVYWALQLDHPVSFEAEEIRDGTNERFPTGARIRWNFPARGEMPAVKVYWYEGFRKGAKLDPTDGLHAAKEGARNLPPLFFELQKKYPTESFDTSGTLYVGEKGIIYTGTYGGEMHVLPWKKMREISQPPKTLPRSKNVMDDFLNACRAGKRETAAAFDYGARLTEFTLLGNLATRAGIGNKVEWNGPEMKITNLPDLNQYVNLPHRSGWMT